MNVGAMEFIWGLIGLVFMIVFWVVVVAIVIKLLKNRPSAVEARSSALEILEERYARGDITHEEFIERRNVLSGRATAPHGSPPPA